MNGNIKTAYLAIACTILLCHFNSLYNGYGLDDELVTGPENAITQDLSNVKGIFTEWYDTQLGSNYEYRPIVKLCFALENKLFGLKPGVHHFFNLLFYFLCCMLLYRFLLRLLQGKHFVALATVMLFAAHPMHTEVVASLKNRDAMLAFIFSFLAGIYVLKMFDEGKFPTLKIVLVLLLFYLAMLSKRDSLIFAFVFPPLLFLRYEKYRMQIAATFVIIAGSYLLLMLTTRAILPADESARKMEFFENPLAGNKSFANRIIALFNSAGFYLLKNFLPVKQVSYYGYNAIEILKPATFYFFTGVAGVTGGIFLLFKSAGKQKTIAYAICFLFGGMILYLNAIKPVPGIVADRFSFVSSIGACLLFVHLIQKIFKSDLEKIVVLSQIPATVKFSVLVLTGAFALVCIIRNAEWRSKETLFAADVAKEPESAKLHSLYALEMIKQYRDFAGIDTAVANDRARIAKEHLEQSLKIYPKYVNSMSNLGYLLLQTNTDIPRAVTLLKQAAEEKKDNAEVQYNFANALFNSGEFEEAENVLIKSLRLKKRLNETYMLLMQVSEKTGNSKRNADSISKSLTPEYRTDAMYTDIGNLYARSKDTMNAVKYYDSAVTVNPVNRQIGGFLFNYYRSKGLPDKAERIRRMFPAK